MNFVPRRTRSIARFNMTPMIDVVLQLIIFFLYTSQFAHLSRTAIDLPEQRGEETSPARATLVVDVRAGGELLVETRPVTMDELVRMVQLETQRAGGDASQIKVLVRPDRNARAGVINELALRLSASGVHQWAMGTVDPGGPGAAGGAGRAP